ncbi:MAG: c-type cytochrome, partial [Chlorobi bacterium]|nr:c-type cytochrome [Chlorobiota bacterium]
LLIGGYAFAQPSAEEGEQLFKQRCASCHDIERKLVGPPLKGITERRGEEWLIKFIRNSQELINAGDQDAVQIFEEYNKIPMPPHPDLTDDQIKSILIYIDQASKGETGAKGQSAQQEQQQVSTVSSEQMQQLVEKGQKLFRQNCAACHKIDKDLTGPALGGITKRRDREWLHRWIRNSQELISEGDPTAVQIFEEWNKVPMPPFTQLSDEDIDAILAYIEHAESPQATTAAPVTGTPVEQVEQPTPTWKTVLIASVIILLLISSIVTIIWRRKAAEIIKQGKEVPTPPTIVEILTSKYITVPLGTIIAVWLMWEIWDWGADLGHSVGYAPEQPIYFSHAIHAGKLGLDCQHCHFGARKGRMAGIPPVSTCMNCHTGVQESNVVLPNGSTGTEEIKKLLAHFESGKPIKWERVFSNPDHVYFNHFQHVVVGQVECQECHGPIETMHKVKKTFRLSMGFCLECHRQRNVNLDNGYYKAYYEDYLKRIHKGKVDGITVAQIGGADCQRCHY